MMKYPGLMTILHLLLISPLVIAQNFTTQPKLSAFPTAMMTQVPSATTIINDRYHFAQPVFHFQQIAPITITALPMTKLIKTEDQTFNKKVFFRLATGENIMIKNFVNQLILPDSSFILNNQPPKPPQRFIREK
ncbi:hypothetical protein JW964_13360 [candidate division KSB1 bacterium]|nr:hypothetical protein [candidate division KSB1 bacterium]